MPAAPRSDTAPVPAEDAASGSMEAYLERLAPEVVGTTYWFDPGPTPASDSVTIRFSGQLVGASPPLAAGEQFVHDQTVTGVVGGSGPIAVTVKIKDVSPGEWAVDAALLAGAGSGASEETGDLYRARWSWLRWRLSVAPASTVRTSLAPLVRAPAVILGSWAVMVFLGIALALVTQSLVISSLGLALSHVLAVSLAAVLAGAIGAKAWFILLHRKDKARDGWCVQGLVAGIALVAPALLAVLSVPIGPFLDATAPGLLIGLATGRVGCFFTGCCAGRPTGSRFALWSSNRSVGARRIPTQPLESVLAFTIAIGALLAVLKSGPRHGAVFIAALAMYTLCRQALLGLREERRQSQRGPRLVAAVAAVVLVVDIALTVLYG